MPKNESSRDRDIRLVVGTGLILAACYGPPALLHLLLFLAGVAVIATAAIGFCPVYQALGINTATKHRQR